MRTIEENETHHLSSCCRWFVTNIHYRWHESWGWSRSHELQTTWIYFCSRILEFHLKYTLRCRCVNKEERLKNVFIDGEHASAGFSMRTYWEVHKEATLWRSSWHAPSPNNLQEEAISQSSLSVTVSRTSSTRKPPHNEVKILRV